MFFYSTIYVGDLYKRSVPPATTDEQQIRIDAEATRLGSRALFFSALLAITVSLIIPAFVTEAAGHSSQSQNSPWWRRFCRVPKGMQVHLVTMWAVSQLVFAGCMFATLCVISSLLFACIVLIGCLLYSLTHSVWGSTLIITATGFSAAIGSWAPFSLVSRIVTVWLILHLNLFQLGEAILTEPVTCDEVTSIHLADARTWPQQGLQTTEDQGERDVFLEHDSEDEDRDEEVGLKDWRQVIANPLTQLSHVNISSGAVDIQDEDYEIISGEQETNGRTNGASRRAVSSTLSSKAGIILVSLLFFLTD